MTRENRPQGAAPESLAKVTDSILTEAPSDAKAPPVTRIRLTDGSSIPVPMLSTDFAPVVDALFLPEEFVSMLEVSPGRGSVVRVLSAAEGRAAAPSTEANVYFGINPVRPGLPPGRRGELQDIVRVAAVWADLDVKAGGFTGIDEAKKCVGQISDVLGVGPTFVIHSGHGIQPVWAADAGDDLFTICDEEDLRRLQEIVRRFGRLVARCAAEQGAAVDNVFDLTRVLRVPGTWNLKEPTAPVQARLDLLDGTALRCDDLVARLDDGAVRSLLDDRDLLVVEQSDPASWLWPQQTCDYVTAMIRGWSTDAPRGSRHHWMLSQATRLAAAWRLRCVSERDHAHALTVLNARFLRLLTEPESRAPGPQEFPDAVRWAVERVAAQSEAQARDELGCHDHAQTTVEGEKPNGAVSTQLVRLAEQHYRFGVTEDGRVFAVAKDRPHLARLFHSGRHSLSHELASKYFQTKGRVASASAISDALAVLQGKGQSGDPEPLHLRVAEHGGDAWIDVGDETGRAIRLRGDEWKVTSEVPVIFERTQLTGPMTLSPRAATGSDGLQTFWELTNIDEADRPVVLSWLIAALIAPNIPHPILAVFGEQGSGKTTTSRLLMDLIDPSAVPLRKPPRDIDTWITAAAGSYGVGLDNVSTVSPALSDSLCRAVTGDADIRRTLFTDGQLTVFSFRRVILLNGIDVGAVRGDLADRLVTLNVRRIEPERRKTEDEIERRWRRESSGILEALLDLASRVMAQLPRVDLVDPPRMADFARILRAVDNITGTRGYDTYRDGADTIMQDSIQSSPFITALTERIDGSFNGTSKQLFEQIRWSDGYPPKDWPRDGRGVTTLLRRNAPALRALGWTVDDDEAKNTYKVLRWTLRPPAVEETQDED